MSKTLFAVIILIILTIFNCESPPVAPELLDTLHNPIHFTVGQRWSYLRRMVWVLDSGIDTTNLSVRVGMPTICEYVNFTAEKDTVVDGAAGIIIQGKFYDSSSLSSYIGIDSFSGRWVVCASEDTVKVYEFKAGSVGGIFMLKRQQGSFDTTVFLDLNYALIFPLSGGKAWYYRFPGNSRGWEPTQLTFLDREQITTPYGSFNTYKIKYQGADSSYWRAVGISWTRWIGEVGSIKDSLAWGRGDIIDEFGRVLGTGYSYTISYYMGSTHVQPDTIIPPVTNISASDRAVVDQYFSNQKYSEWLKWMVTSNKFVIDPKELGSHNYRLMEFVDSQRTANVGWDSIKSGDTTWGEYVSADLPDLKIADSNQYYKIIILYQAFTQGWMDVNPSLDSLRDTIPFGSWHPDSALSQYAPYAISAVSGSDTTWKYYNSLAPNHVPFRFGYSAKQQEVYNRVFGD